MRGVSSGQRLFIGQDAAAKRLSLPSWLTEQQPQRRCLVGPNGELINAAGCARWYTNVFDVVALVLARGGVEGRVRKLQRRVAGVGGLLEDDL